MNSYFVNTEAAAAAAVKQKTGCFEDIEEMVFYEYDGGGEREDSVKDEL